MKDNCRKKVQNLLEIANIRLLTHNRLVAKESDTKVISKSWERFCDAKDSYTLFFYTGIEQ